MLEVAARSQHDRLRTLLLRDHPGLLETYPVERHVDALEAPSPSVSYVAVPLELRAAAAEIASSFGDDALCTYNELLLSRLIVRWPQRARERRLPASVTDATCTLLEGVVAALTQGRSARARMGNDRFAKDLAVARGKLVVCGPELVDLEGGIPRSVVLQPPRHRAVARLAFLLGRVGGVAPLLESHMDRRLAREFSPEGYERMYDRLADLLAWNPRLKGFVGAGAWFCDPAVREFSPELGFVTELPLAHGAKLLPAASSEATVRDATRMSPVRSAAFAAGTYVPRSFMLVWPRRDLLGWAESRRRAV